MTLLLMKMLHLKYDFIQGVMTPWNAKMTPWTLFTIILLSSCTIPIPESDRPNIVWITSEDNSKHYLKLFDDNGVSTPNIEKLASEGIIYRHAFSNAPVCSVARSTLITGCYAPRVGAQFHRKIQIVPMPDSLQMFPAYLREAGYYTTNNSKEDYNLIKDSNVWDESSRTATWRNRKNGQPFFHVFNIGISHESSLHFNREDMDKNKTVTDQQSFTVQPNHPETDLFRYTNALYRDKIQEMDRKVGEVVEELEKDGLLENTFIFYFGDHGGVLPGSKGYLYETGLHVPLVIYIPEKYRADLKVRAGMDQNGFVSFVDFAPTVLSLAGIEVPGKMDGRPFLGAKIDPADISQRETTYSYADRFDEKYDQVRAVRKGRYKYIRYFQPFNFDGLMNNYRYKQLAYQEWWKLYRSNSLNEIQASFFQSHSAEALFDVESDPFETNNLSDNPDFRQTLLTLHENLDEWLTSMPDLSLFPEHHLIKNAFNNPTQFGQEHKQEIEKYLGIANLLLDDIPTVKDQLMNNLKAVDPWSRYWAIIACTAFGEETASLTPDLLDIAHSDPELINRVKAAEFLAVIDQGDPGTFMINALYQSTDPAEALLILNSIVLLKDGFNYPFTIDKSSLTQNIRENDEVKRRLEYLD